MVIKLPSQLLDQEYNYPEAAAAASSSSSSSSSSLSFNKSESTKTWSCFGSSDSGSVFSSTETESEQSDDEYMAELNRQMSHYMLQDDNPDRKQEKVPWISSAKNSLQPPPSTWKPSFNNNHHHQESPKFQSKQGLIDHQIRSIQYYKLNLEQVQPRKNQNPTKKKGNIIHPQSSKTKSCGGTGVFLPQPIGHQASDSIKQQGIKQQGCSTVLIPARVIEALKRHFDKVGVPSRLTGNFHLQNDGSMGLKINTSLNSQQQRPAPASNHPEIIALPKEWTY